MNKRATIKDVAKLAGVGISVVSYVLNNTEGKTLPEKTRQKVLEAARQLNYVPNSIARSMRLKKTNFIGVVSLWHAKDPAFIDILDGILSEAQKFGYSVVLLSIRQKCDNYDYINLFLRHQIDGIVFVSYSERIENYDEARHLSKMRECGVPFVVVNGNTSEPDTSYVYLDSYTSGIIGTEYLINLNHKNIIFTLINKENLFSSQKSKAGYISTMEKHNYSSSVVDISGIGKIYRMIKSGEISCTGIVCSKCDVAHMAYVEASKYNIRIPEEVSVIACNFHNFAPYMHPPLTTVTPPMTQIGEVATKHLIEQLENSDETPSILSVKLPGVLMERESAKKLNP